MKTTPFKAMQAPESREAPQPQFSYHYEQGFAVLVGGKEIGCSFFGVFYTVIELLRSRVPMKVYFQQGPLLFEHDGKQLIAGQPYFLQVLADFEGYMLAERNGGKREALEAIRTAEAARAPNTPATEPSPPVSAPAPAPAPEQDPVQPTTNQASDSARASTAVPEGVLRPSTGRRRR